MVTDEEIEWLLKRLHSKDCRQCDLVRALIAERSQ